MALGLRLVCNGCAHAIWTLCVSFEVGVYTADIHYKNCEVLVPALAILIYTPLSGLAEVAEVKIKIPLKSPGWMLQYLPLARTPKKSFLIKKV